MTLNTSLQDSSLYLHSDCCIDSTHKNLSAKLRHWNHEFSGQLYFQGFSESIGSSASRQRWDVRVSEPFRGSLLQRSCCLLPSGNVQADSRHRGCLVQALQQFRAAPMPRQSCSHGSRDGPFRAGRARSARARRYIFPLYSACWRM